MPCPFFGFANLQQNKAKRVGFQVGETSPAHPNPPGVHPGLAGAWPGRWSLDANSEPRAPAPPARGRTLREQVSFWTTFRPVGIPVLARETRSLLGGTHGGPQVCPRWQPWRRNSRCLRYPWVPGRVDS